jgi:transaldolase
MGLVDGCTTNPSLIAKEKRSVRPLLEEIKTRVLAASIRSPLHVLDAAKAGAHVATMPFPVLEMLMKHPLTDVGLKRFADDWNKSGAKISGPKLSPGYEGWA